jgi:hypothetical protein
MVLTQEEQDVRRLSDQTFPGLQERRREGDASERSVVEQREHALFATIGAGDIDVGCAGLFERKPDKFTASLY